MKKFIKISLCLLGVSMFAVGCSDNDKWTPGPQDNEIGDNVYFPLQSSRVILSPLSDLSITATIERVNTAEAAAIPVTVTANFEGLVYPETVEFEAGQESSTFTIDCADMPQGQFEDITISLPEDQTDIYGPGMHSITFSVIVSDWKLIADNVKYHYTTTYSYGSKNLEFEDKNKLYPDTDGELYILDNTTVYRITNFFGSGLDIMFEANSTKWIEFKGLNNVWETGDSYGGWYIYNESAPEDEQWFSWYPGGETMTGIQYLYFNQYYSTTIYSYAKMVYDTDTLYGCLAFTNWVTYTDDSETSAAFCADFNLKYNPYINN